MYRRLAAAALKRNRRTLTFDYAATYCFEKRFNTCPFKIPVNRLRPKQFERFTMLVIHAIMIAN